MVRIRFPCAALRLIAAAGVALTGVLGGGALAQEPIRIGTFLSVTGPAAFLGDPELKTLEMYVEKINAEGGLLGRKVQLVSYDDAGGGEQAQCALEANANHELVSCRCRTRRIGRS